MSKYFDMDKATLVVEAQAMEKALHTAVQIINTLEGNAESDERRITDLRRLVKWLQKGE